ncbi:MAG: ABC transporter permease [Bellilinea sp.]
MTDSQETTTKTEAVPVKPNAMAIFIEEVRQNSLTVTILAIVTGLLLGGIVAVLTTESVYAAFGTSFGTGFREVFRIFGLTYSALFTGAFGQPDKIQAAIASGDWQQINIAFSPFFESLVQSTPYILAGLAVALGFRVGLFNIGAEGQIFVGALAAVWAGTHITGLPAWIHAPLALLIGGLGGALWGFIPGLLKAKTGANEVINTIMMNYIAFRLSEYLLTGFLKDPTKSHPISATVEKAAWLPRLFPSPNRFHVGFFIALAMAVLVYILLFKTTWGFQLRTVGLNPNAARYSGMSIVKSTVIAMSLSGALAGLAGAVEVLGVNRNLGVAFSSGYGFDSIALALLGNSHPVGVVLASLLFGFLRNGALRMQLAAGIPIDIISIMQAAILAFIAAPGIIRTIYRLKEPKEEIGSPILTASRKEKPL